MSMNFLNNQKPVSGSTIRATMLARLLTLLALVTIMMSPLNAQTGNIPSQYGTSTTGISGLHVTNPAQQGPSIQVPTNGPSGIQPLNGGQGSSTSSMTLLYPDPTQYVLSAGDLLSIRIYDAPDYYSTVRVTKDGSVLLPLIGSVSLGGITIRQGEDLIASKLKTAGMYRDPEVIIGIAESSSPETISFIGEKNGVFLVQGKRSLLDVLAGAGGLPQGAGRTVSIIRPGVDAPILVNLGTTPQDLVKANIPIQPHDTIFVERAGSVYVLGAFKQQGALPLEGTTMTLMQAASLAGGPLYAGKYNDMRIVRTVGTERQEVKVDIKRIMYGLDPDPILQSGDIIFLPTQALKLALASGGLQTLLGAVSILVLAAYR